MYSFACTQTWMAALLSPTSTSGVAAAAGLQTALSSTGYLQVAKYLADKLNTTSAVASQVN